MAHNRLTLDDIDPDWEVSGRWRVGAEPGAPGGMVLPVDRVFVHHTDSHATRDVRADVAAICDYDQHKFGKVSYSYLLHAPSNTVVEVEGLHRGAHTINNDQQSLNGVSFGVGVVGNFQPDAEPQPADQATAEHVRLIVETVQDELVAAGHVTPDYVLEAHRDAPYATACCGDSLYGRLDEVRRLLPLPDTTPTPLEDDMPTVAARKILANPDHPGEGYVLDAQGGLHGFGGAPAVTDGPYWQDSGVAMDAVVVDWDPPAGYVLDALGGVHPFGGAPAVTDGPYWPGGFVPPAPKT